MGTVPLTHIWRSKAALWVALGLAAVASFALLTLTGLTGTNLRATLVSAMTVLVAGFVRDRRLSALLTWPYLLLTLVFAVFAERLDSSPVLLALVGAGAVSYAVGVWGGHRVAAVAALPLAAAAYVAQANAVGLEASRAGEVVHVDGLRAETAAGAGPLLSLSGPNTVYEFWNETCGPCIRSLQRLGAYRDDYAIVAVYLPFFGSDPQDVHRYVDYRVSAQAVSVGEGSSIRGVPFAVVTDETGAVCYQGHLKDDPLDFVSGTYSVLRLRC